MKNETLELIEALNHGLNVLMRDVYEEAYEKGKEEQKMVHSSHSYSEGFVDGMEFAANMIEHSLEQAGVI